MTCHSSVYKDKYPEYMKDIDPSSVWFSFYIDSREDVGNLAAFKGKNYDDVMYEASHYINIFMSERVMFNYIMTQNWKKDGKEYSRVIECSDYNGKDEKLVWYSNLSAACFSHKRHSN